MNSKKKTLFYSILLYLYIIQQYTYSILRNSYTFPLTGHVIMNMSGYDYYILRQ